MRRGRVAVVLLLCVLLALPTVLQASSPGQEEGEGSAPILGLNYGPFREEQSPDGLAPSADEIREDMALLAERVNVLRIYSAQGISATIVEEAEALGLQIVLQAWIGPDLENNAREIEAVIDLAGTHANVIGVLVGSEVMLRGDLDALGGEALLLGYLQQVRAAVEVPVGYADILTVWLDHPALATAVDWVGLHSYGFWNCHPVGEAAQFAWSEWGTLRDMSGFEDQRIVLFETGWPTDGYNENCPDSTAGSEDDQRDFVVEMLVLAVQEGIDLFLFEFADEPWKCYIGTETLVGCHWGLLNADRSPKPAWDVLEAAPAGVVTVTADPAANCRTGPGENFQIEVSLPNGTEVTILEEDGNDPPVWVRVEAEGTECWVSYALLSAASAVVTAPPAPVATREPTGGEQQPTQVPPTAPPPTQGVTQISGRSPICALADPNGCPAGDPSDNQSLAQTMWQNFANQTALNCACRLDALFHTFADIQQVERLNAGECDLQPPGSSDDPGFQAYFSRYWALSDVGAAWWVASKAYQAMGRTDLVSEINQVIADSYSCAWLWDPSVPVFWSLGAEARNCLAGACQR